VVFVFTFRIIDFFVCKYVICISYNYRSQNETLKKEILDQERGLKCQIAALEKKAHENWVR
jgi:hypothetical protein